MAHFIGQAELVYSRHGVAAADDGYGAVRSRCRHELRHFARAFRERLELEYAHGTVPDYAFCPGNYFFICFEGLRPYVHSHEISGNIEGIDCLDR